VQTRACGAVLRCRASADKASIGADGQSLVGGDAYGVDAPAGSDANTLDGTEQDAAAVSHLLGLLLILMFISTLAC
jgi:hypothetical protein